MKTQILSKRVLPGILLLSLCCALILCGIRVGKEREYKKVCVAMPPDALAQLAAWNGLENGEAAAAAIGIRVMEREALNTAGYLVEDDNQYSYDSRYGAYLPEGENTRVFYMNDWKAKKYGTLGSTDEKPVEDMLFRAVSERNMRLLYLELMETADGEIVTELTPYVRLMENLTARLSAQGFTVGEEISLLAPYTPSPLLRYLTALGILAEALWLLLLWFPGLPAAVSWLLLGLGAAGSLVLLRWLPALFTSGFALLAVIAASCHAMSGAAALSSHTPGKPLAAYGVTLLRVLGIALSGGLMIAALQSGSEWLLAVRNFRGVKVSLLLPLLLMGLWALRKICSLRVLLRGRLLPLLAGGVVLAGAVGYLLLRSGNASPAVTVAEHQLRAWLENSLPVRPRTKEFLVGWPCLGLCVGALLAGWKRLAVPCYVLAAVAPSSVLNTFCHSRSPLIQSVARSLLGAAIGFVLGVILIELLRLAQRKRNQEIGRNCP